MINLMLPHLCEVRRARSDYSDGSPVRTWQTVSEGIPCLYAATGVETRVDADMTPSRSIGTFYAEPDADVQPGDKVIVSGVGTFTVGTVGGVQLDWCGEPHHLEWQVSQP